MPNVRRLYDDAATPHGASDRGERGSIVPFPCEPPDNNLPLELDSFVGREREVSEVKELLAGKPRLLTLTGPGGCGKTRLALRVASGSVDGFEDGAWWVGLAPLIDPERAVALGVGEVAGRPPTEVLVEHLGSKRLLLVMDNCEHLVEACAPLAEALLRACPNLKILATSREALGVAGESAWLVPSLSLPDPEHPPPVEELARYEAVRLFVERAGKVASTFVLTDQNASAVAQVCRKLDGIPLAIELAAARAKVLSAEQISWRLEDPLKLLTAGSRTADPRQQTLRATLRWGHELLDEQERKLFGRLSVFAGGWTLEATEAVGTGIGIEEDDVLDLLSGLVDKSMAVAEQSAQEGASFLRYKMLEPVRQYGQERLEEGGEAEQTRERHARYYLRLAEEAEPDLREQDAWLKRLEREHGNFRAALSWALEGAGPEERAELGLRLAAALGRGRFWNAYGPSEGRRWLERGLARSGASAVPVRAKALNEAGWIASFQGDHRRAVALLEEGRALFEELEDKPGVATSLFFWDSCRCTAEIGSARGRSVEKPERCCGSWRIAGKKPCCSTSW